jgi:hypothetical protein
MRDLDRALSSVRAGQRFGVQVLRDGASVELALTMPALGADARQEHATRSLIPLPGATSWLARD